MTNTTRTLIAISALLVGCGDSANSTDTAATPVIDVGAGSEYHPALDPAHIADVIDNPYLPLLVGSRWVYEGMTEDGVETTTVVVTGERRTVMGISAYVVRDTVELDGELIEDTYDWFTQDDEGNVWYLGEEVKNYEDGVLMDTHGSWEAGVDGALPGIVMPAQPVVGDAFRQEYYVGEAEDMFEIIEIGGTQTVPAGTFNDVVTTKDWNPLDPEVIEEKSYAPGVGLIYETHVAGGAGTVELVSFTAGS